MKTLIRLTLVTNAVAVVLFGLHSVADAGKPAPPPPPVNYTTTFLDANLRLEKMNESGAAVGWTSGTSPRAMVRLADGTLVDLTLLIQFEIPSCPWTLFASQPATGRSSPVAAAGRSVSHRMTTAPTPSPTP